jgi:hypothetical protein
MGYRAKRPRAWDQGPTHRDMKRRQIATTFGSTVEISARYGRGIPPSNKSGVHTLTNYMDHGVGYREVLQFLALRHA